MRRKKLISSLASNTKPFHLNPSRPPLKVRGGEGGVMSGGGEREFLLCSFATIFCS
jgi:hypothetical protein